MNFWRLAAASLRLAASKRATLALATASLSWDVRSLTSKASRDAAISRVRASAFAAASSRDSRCSTAALSRTIASAALSISAVRASCVPFRFGMQAAGACACAPRARTPGLEASEGASLWLAVAEASLLADALDDPEGFTSMLPAALAVVGGPLA
eukprot:CAMPEP_0183359070 /NCGR_PEP_ID=MMETSP0164_2-20130417/51116_1 /TAXON_ID=221442 /ORGANISM="Coccolithus pelagicus ssp braarudi, Strain PLY182g" /LENGTH=154 /DNA_ID=CAMNT_0025533097 /DNA_START=342 /DNA_END=806 /DNA_ORIENTATION=+